MPARIARCAGGQAAIERALDRLHGPVGVRHDPGRGALEHVQLLHVGLDLGHELDRRRAGAHHRHALAARGRARGPSGPSGTSCPRSCSMPGTSGSLGSLSGPWPATSTSAVSSPWEVSSRQWPASSSQSAPRSSCSKRTCGVTPKRSRHVAQVLEDLRLRRERARPVGVGGEGEGVEVRGHVAAAARIGVVAPGAAQLARALEQHEVALAVLEQARSAIPMPEKPLPTMTMRWCWLVT